MARRRRRRYAWALQFATTSDEVRRLSREARAGLAYAQILAENARDRSAEALRGVPPERLTVAALAADDDVSPVVVHTRIKQARIELFGRDLSDSAIYYRLRRRESLPPRRYCAEVGCARQLPASASARRRYCDEHIAPAARVRRYRQGQRAAT
jgi:hypothetical protein